MRDIIQTYQNMIIKIGAAMEIESEKLMKNGELCEKTLAKLDKLGRIVARISLVRSRALAERKREEKNAAQADAQPEQANQDNGGIEHSKEVLARPDLQKLVREMKEEMIENSKKPAPYSKEAFLKELEENPIPRMQQVF